MSAAPGSGGSRVLALGGSSEIALAIVRELQSRAPRDVALVGRDGAALGAAAAELSAAGCPRVIAFELDALELGRHEEVLEQAFHELGGADIVIVAVGVLGERGGLPADIAAATAVLQVNLVGAGSLLMHAARHLRERGGGTIVVLSSVAAERPRRANAVYGASKAGLDSLAQALGDDLHEHGVHVLVVRPGFVQHEDDARPRCGAAGDHAPGRCRRRRGWAGPRRAHRVGAPFPTLADARDEARSPSPLPQDQAMSAARSSRQRPTELAPPPADISALRMRRRQARRRRRLARVDVGLGVAGALVLLIASPGLAITGLIAALVLAACVVSFLVQRRRSRRAARAPRARPRAGSSARRRA